MWNAFLGSLISSPSVGNEELYDDKSSNTTLLVGSIAFLLVIAGLMYFLSKQKQAKA